jgi:hypothetical protein
MAKILILACSLCVVIKGERVTIKPSTKIDLPDKKYGLKDADVKRIVNAGGGTVSESSADKIDDADQADKG